MARHADPGLLHLILPNPRTVTGTSLPQLIACYRHLTLPSLTRRAQAKRACPVLLLLMIYSLRTVTRTSLYHYYLLVPTPIHSRLAPQPRRGCVTPEEMWGGGCRRGEKKESCRYLLHSDVKTRLENHVTLDPLLVALAKAETSSHECNKYVLSLACGYLLDCNPDAEQ